MPSIEKRKHERIKLASQPKGTLALRIDDQPYPVARVQDVSSYGVNVLVEDAIPEKARITVEYADDSLRLDVYGIVAWRAERRDDSGAAMGHVIGIELFSPTLLTAVLGAPQ